MPKDMCVCVCVCVCVFIKCEREKGWENGVCMYVYNMCICMHVCVCVCECVCVCVYLLIPWLLNDIVHDPTTTLFVTGYPYTFVYSAVQCSICLASV